MTQASVRSRLAKSLPVQTAEVAAFFYDVAGFQTAISYPAGRRGLKDFVQKHSFRTLFY
jgi:hypothetical protein